MARPLEPDMGNSCQSTSMHDVPDILQETFSRSNRRASCCIMFKKNQNTERTSLTYKQQPSPGRTTAKVALEYVGHSWEGGKEIGPKKMSQREEDYVTLL